MPSASVSRSSRRHLLCLALLMFGGAAASAQAADDLVMPLHIGVAPGLAPAQAQVSILAARRYYSFWNTGEARYAEAALAPDFVDTNLPPGRPQGVQGPLEASRAFRAAVPDLRLEVEDMQVTAERVVGRLHFTGHFSGRFGAHQGDGRAIDFRAVDIYTVRDGRIAENWHLEDNLTLLRQLGVVAD